MSVEVLMLKWDSFPKLKSNKNVFEDNHIALRCDTLSVENSVGKIGTVH